MRVNPQRLRLSSLDMLLTPTIGPMRRGIAQLLRTIAFADGAARQTPNGSAHSVERAVGWAYQDDGLIWTDSGRVNRARRGESNLGPGPLTKICLHFSSVAKADCPLFWASFQGKGAMMKSPYAKLGLSARFIVQWGIPLPPAPGKSRDPSEIDLARLAFEGSFDAVAVLWYLLDTTSDPAKRLRIGRYVPPALALLALHPTAVRLIHVIFARLRQAHLDGLAHKGRQLALTTYDLVKAQDDLFAATGTRRWGDLRQPHPPRIRIEAMRTWMAHHLAPLEAEGPRLSRWAIGLSPAEHMLEPNMGLDERVTVPLQALLGDYWGSLPVGVMQARHEPRPPARRKAPRRAFQDAAPLGGPTRNGAMARDKCPRSAPKRRRVST